MFTTAQIPAGVLDAITAPETINITEIVAATTRGAQRIADEITAGRDLSDHARGDVYYGACEAMFNTFLDRVADRDGADRAGQLAADIDAELDAADLRRLPA